VCTTSIRVYLLLAAPAATARWAEHLPARVRALQRWPAAACASVPRTAGRCCAGRGAVCRAARIWRVDADTQLLQLLNKSYIRVPSHANKASYA